jgi:hypothetical protein
MSRSSPAHGEPDDDGKEPMLIGEYIMRLTGLDQFSSPFGRGGQNAVFSIDVLDVPANGAALAIDVEHKNLEDTTWTTLGSFSSITSTGVKTLGVTGAKEMLRFNYSLSGGSGPDAADSFYINTLAPVWRP